MGEDISEPKSLKEDPAGEHPSPSSAVKSRGEISEFKQHGCHPREWQPALRAGLLLFKPLEYLPASPPFMPFIWALSLGRREAGSSNVIFRPLFSSLIGFPPCNHSDHFKPKSNLLPALGVLPGCMLWSLPTYPASVSGETSSSTFSVVQLHLFFIIPWICWGIASPEISAYSSLSSWIMSIHPSALPKCWFFGPSHSVVPDLQHTQAVLFHYILSLLQCLWLFCCWYCYSLRSHFDFELQMSKGNALFFPIVSICLEQYLIYMFHSHLLDE